MGKKGKGRQSGGFGCKSQRAAYTSEWRDQASEVVFGYNETSEKSGDPFFTTTTTTPFQRPKLTRVGKQLERLLQERNFQESQELMEQRRRAGFVLDRTCNQTPTSIEDAHPPGWILQYGKHSGENIPINSTGTRRVASLESICLSLLSQYISQYLEAMGREELHDALSLLPAEMLTALSQSISRGKGMSDDLAYVVGKHAHVKELCFRSTTNIGDGNMLTDNGIKELVPRLPTSCDEETWDDWEEAYNYHNKNDGKDEFQKRYELVVDSLLLDGVNVALKRLELVDCLYVSADAVLALLEKCACITHLSLAGSIQVVADGVQILRALPELLPSLQVLDVTRCGWMSASVLREFHCAYANKNTFRKAAAPIVHCDRCFIEGYFVPALGDHSQWF